MQRLRTEKRDKVRSVVSAEAEKDFDGLLQVGEREPIFIREENRDVAVVNSPEDYERLRRIKIDRFNATCDRIAAEAKARGLTEEKLAEILADDE